MKVKEESEKVGLKLNIQKTKSMASDPITSWQLDGETVETVADFIFRGSKESEIAQSCPTLCDPRDCGLPSSSVHGIFQAIVLELIAISFSSGSSWPRDRTQVSCIVDRRFTIWATREVYKTIRVVPKFPSQEFVLSYFPLYSKYSRGLWTFWKYSEE